MDFFKINLQLQFLFILLSLSSVCHAGSCMMGTSVKATTGALNLAIDPGVAIGDILGYRYSKGFAGQTLVLGCTGSSPYRSASLLTASTTVAGAYETGIPGVGVIIGDLYKTGMTVPYTTSLGPGALTPWTTRDEVRLTFVKTGPVTPGTSGNKVYGNFYLNSSVFATLTVSSLTVIQKSCLADVNSKNQIVDLGSPNRSEFSGVGSTAVSSERNFSVIMQCEADNIPVQVTFDPVGTSQGEGQLPLTTDNNSASGVAVEILDINRVPLTFATAKTYHNSAERKIEIPLIARYKQTGSITPGTANAAMTFTITQN
ncbi:fimbrial protein [Erwinia sp. P6884]|uniref:fimbrial protein n=1 Tax=Erwinia sp. P6884 TaxID=3141450 RepID=UPI00318975F4